MKFSTPPNNVYLATVQKAVKPVTQTQSIHAPRVIQNRTGMNRGALLNKIAEFVTNTDKSLPYRRRVEVAIFKDGKVLLTKNKDKKDGSTWYGFPGGGTDDDTDAEAARKECLEEVGVELDNLQATDILHTQEGIGSKDGRDKKYRGSRTKMFTADYRGKDTSILEDDARRYIWATVDEAKKLLVDNKVDSSYRVKALTAHKDT
jgi:8-oxo-dGTP pyrophosphatase MutT (NUDIX family)